MNRRMSWDELSIFTRQIRSALKMQLPLHEAVRAQAEQAPIGLRLMLQDIAEGTEEGIPLADCLEKYPRSFSDFYQDVVRTGEQSGTLPEMLSMLAKDVERSHEMRVRTRRMLAYPLFLLLLVLIDAFLFMVFLLPKFAWIYHQFHKELPAFVQGFVRLSNFCTQYFPFIAAGLVGLWLIWHLTVRMRRRPGGWDRLLLSIPIWGRFEKSLEAARLCHCLESLLKANVAVPEALEYAAQNARNSHIRRILANGAAQVRKGEPLAVSLEKGFPSSLVWMLTHAEKQGDLPEQLKPIARFYDEEFQTASAMIKQVVEPVLLILVALVVASLVLAIYLPVFTIPTALILFG